MKKFMAILAVLALTGTAMAEVAITAAEGTGADDDMLVIGYSGEPLVGLALVLDCGTGGDMIDVSGYWVDSFFDVYVDAYYTTPGDLDDDDFSDDDTTPFADPDAAGEVTSNAAKVSLCIAALPTDHLGKDPATPVAKVNVVDGDADNQVTVTVSLDMLRGGPVTPAGAVAATINGGASDDVVISINGGCPCLGDVYPPGAADLYVTFDDLSYLAFMLESGGWFVQPGDTYWNECADVYPPGTPDGYLTFDDLSYLAYMLEQASWFIDCH
jgi:hypothetical protein